MVQVIKQIWKENTDFEKEDFEENEIMQGVEILHEQVKFMLDFKEAKGDEFDHKFIDFVTKTYPEALNQIKSSL